MSILSDPALTGVAKASASGPIASFSDGAKGLPLRSLVANIDPVQAGTGDPSPDNVRPISGWTEVGVTVAGANLCGGDVLRDNIKNYMPSATDNAQTRSITFSGSASLDTNYRIMKGVFKENTRYTFMIALSKDVSAPSSNLRVYYTDGTYINIPGVTALNTKETVVFISAAGKTVSNLSKTYQAGNTTVYYDESGVFEGVLTAADFVPYIGTTTTIQLGQTVYGGTLDVINGVLTVDRVSADLGTLSWSRITSDNAPYFRATNTGMKDNSSSTAIPNVLCSIYKTDISQHIGASGYDDIISISTSGSRVFVQDTRYDDAATFKAAMSGVQLVYELATPITIPLTSTEISTLQWQNNVWADSGDVTVEYLKQTLMHIGSSVLI